VVLITAGLSAEERSATFGAARRHGVRLLGPNGLGLHQQTTAPDAVGHLFLGSKAGTDVTSSTANIRVEGDSLTTNTGSTFNVASTGTLTVEPTSGAFSGAVSTAQWSLGSSLSELTIGKQGNTANVTIGSATTVAGPITVYGGNINLSADIAVTTAHDLKLLASKDIVASTGTDLSTQGGDILFTANTDGMDGGGVLFVEDANAGLAQGRGHGVVAGVGAADAEASARQDPRQSLHADPAHADEMERLLAVELQAQGHLRRSAENTVPEGCCRAPMSYEFHRCLRSPHRGPVRAPARRLGSCAICKGLPRVMGLNFSSGMRSRLGRRSPFRPDPPESDPPQSDPKRTSSDLHRVGGYGCSCGDPDHLTNGTGAPPKEPHRDLCMICGRITLSSGPRRFLP
jgi:hypothetical protein